MSINEEDEQFRRPEDRPVTGERQAPSWHPPENERPEPPLPAEPLEFEDELEAAEADVAAGEESQWPAEEPDTLADGDADSEEPEPVPAVRRFSPPPPPPLGRAEVFQGLYAGMTGAVSGGGVAAMRQMTPLSVASVRPSRVGLLVIVYTIGLLMFLAIEPTRPWMLLVVTALVTAGADGILRTNPRGEFEGDIAGTAPFLFLPALFTLGSGLFLEDVVEGYWVVPGAALSALFLGWIVYAEHVSIDETSDVYAIARLVLNVGTYLTAFAFFAVVYTFDVSLVPAAIAVGLVTLLLSVEVLREAEADPVRALVFAGVIGLVVAEARWGLYFLPLESYLAAVFLLLCFYLASGLVQHHLTNDLRIPVVMEFVAIAGLGIAIVALGRIFESSGSLTP